MSRHKNVLNTLTIGWPPIHRSTTKLPGQNQKTRGLQKYILVQGWYMIKMGLELFHKVPAGAIETLFDEQNQPLFKRADL